MFRSVCLTMVLALACAAFADGEGKPAPSGGDTKKNDASDEPLVPVKGRRFKVQLKSGRSITGVVTAPKGFERREGTSWRECDRDAPGAGLRVFFLHGQDGFVFLPGKDIKAAEDQGDVADDDGMKMAKQRVESAHRAENERDQLRKDREAKRAADRAAAEAADKGGDKGSDSGGSAEDRLARFTALLTKFPPGKWTPETPKEIERRRIVMDLFPTDEEKEFLKVFDDWMKAYGSWKAGQDKVQPATPTKGK